MHLFGSLLLNRHRVCFTWLLWFLLSLRWNNNWNDDWNNMLNVIDFSWPMHRNAAMSCVWALLSWIESLKFTERFREELRLVRIRHSKSNEKNTKLNLGWKSRFRYVQHEKKNLNKSFVFLLMRLNHLITRLPRSHFPPKRIYDFIFVDSYEQFSA